MSKQVEDHLIGKGFEHESATSVVRWLESKGILDDERFVTNFVAAGGYSSRAVVERKLVMFGLEPEAATLAALRIDDVTERKSMEALLIKRGYKVHERAKAGRFLFSKGFPEDGIEHVLDSYFNAFDEPSS